MFFANLFRRGAMLPGVAFGLLVLSAILIGGVYPLLIQNFQVKPNEVNKEAPYIARNIHATRDAYGVANASVTDYNASTKLTPAQEQADGGHGAQHAAARPEHRVADLPAAPADPGYYRFPDPLDIDRYPDSTGTAAGHRHRGARAGRAAGRPAQLDQRPPGLHPRLRRRRGARATASTPPAHRCSPRRASRRAGTLALNQPRIYFGEQSPTYSIVGGSKTPGGGELDYPSDTSATGQVNNSYDGTGGVARRIVFNQLLYAVKFKRAEHPAVRADQHRSRRSSTTATPIERVQKVAPWLTIDGDPYPAVVDGRIVVDHRRLHDDRRLPVLAADQPDRRDDGHAHRSAPAGHAPGDQINYIRNSVKATVDAYNGTVTLYAWDADRPGAEDVDEGVPRRRCKPRSAISRRPDGAPALPRGPVQGAARRCSAKYHVTERPAVLQRQDFWQVPDDPTNDGNTCSRRTT